MGNSFLSTINLFGKLYEGLFKKVRKNIEVYCPDKYYLLLKVYEKEDILNEAITGYFFTKPKTFKKKLKYKKSTR